MTATGPGRWLLAAAGVVVVATVAMALWIIGSPAAQREARLDEARQQDLVAIQRAVASYWTVKKRLPTSLTELASEPGNRLDIVDPVDRKAYVYEATGTGTGTYRLCAVFTTDTAESAERAGRYQGLEHGRGLTCFERNAASSRN